MDPTARSYRPEAAGRDREGVNAVAPFKALMPHRCGGARHEKGTELPPPPPAVPLAPPGGRRSAALGRDDSGRECGHNGKVNQRCGVKARHAHDTKLCGENSLPASCHKAAVT